MPRAPTPRWQDLLDAFLDHERAVGGFATSTLRHRDLYLRTYAAWCVEEGGGLDPCGATHDDLVAFMVAEADRGIAASTRVAELATLRRFHAWLVRTGRATTDPTTGLESPTVRPPDIEVYRPAEVARILAHTAGLDDQRGRLRDVVVRCLRFTGMRSVELRTLRLDALDLDAGEARVRGKAERWRTVVLPPPLVETLERFLVEVRPGLPDSPLLLSNPARLVTTEHRGFGPEAVHREVELAGRDAGVPGRHFPHRWRHTFATELVRAGVDIHVVQRLLGHASVASTVHYTHLAVDDLRKRLAGLW